MNETRWIRLTGVENIPLREGREVMVGTRAIAVFNLGDRYLAVDNRCPHKQGPLADGIVTGAAVVCPLHAWRVNLGTGAVERPTAGVGQCVRAYSTRVDDGVICIEVPVSGPAGGYSYATTTNESAA
jgi:nitrite reductase (NADH) small subunit